MIAALLLAACGEKAAETPVAASTAPAPAPKLQLADLPAPYNAADLASGKEQFLKCGKCHSLKPADGNLIGPNLHGVFARRPGAAPKFRYSEAMQKLQLERWKPEELDKWLANPETYLPKTGMFFDGIKDANKRRDVIAYLMTES